MSNPLCKYKDLFGKVGEGVHSYKIASIAVVDVLSTVVIAYGTHLVFPKYSFIFILTIWFILGILLHRLFCVKTTVDKLLF